MIKLLTIAAAITLIMGIFSQNAQAFVPKKYVTTTGAGTGDGSSWGNAYNGTQLQIAIDAAVASAYPEVWVAKGTYKPTTGTDRTISFQMKNNVTIYGGFAGTESAVSQRITYGAGEINETILSGDIGTLGVNTDNSYHVIYAWRLNSSAILDGFTITKGYANEVSDYQYTGGGMLVYQSSSTINNCRFISNFGLHGGGVYWTNPSSPTFNNCVFSSNSADGYGGGVFGEYPATFNNCTISLNSVNTFGGGIVLYDATSSTTILNNCIVWGNTSLTSGNQISLHGGSPITLNYSCYSNGAGDINSGGGTFTATNNNITSDPQFVNAAGGDYRVLGASPCVDAGNDGYNSQPYDIRGSAYSRKLNKTTGAIGTIDMGAFEYKVSNDPLPVELNSFTATTKQNNVELKWKTATEIDNYGFEIERKAIDNGQLTMDNWSKIGFVEGNGTTNAPKEYSFGEKNIPPGKYSYRLKQIDRDGKYEYSKIVEATVADVKTFGLEQNYPNPFNPVTMINYQLPMNSLVTLKVYDALGREVSTLVNEVMEAGTYSRRFDGSSFSNGVYFYTLRAGSFSSTMRFNLIK